MPKNLTELLHGHLQIVVGTELQNKPVFPRSTLYQCFIPSNLVFQFDSNSLNWNNMF